MAIKKARLEGRANLRPLKNPVYDTAHITAAAIQLLQFFNAPIGQPIVAAGANKTEVDTNLKQSGSLGKPSCLDLYGISIEVINDGADAINNVLNYHLIYDRASFEFAFGQNRALVRVPFLSIPNGPAIDGAVATADAGTPTQYAYLHNGVPSVRSHLDVAIGGIPVPIGPQENFSATVRWPVAITTGVLYRARCYLKGVYYQQL